jgi:hypothetical protein
MVLFDEGTHQWQSNAAQQGKESSLENTPNRPYQASKGAHINQPHLMP